jgi:hypothetical protein
MALTSGEYIAIGVGGTLGVLIVIGVLSKLFAGASGGGFTAPFLILIYFLPYLMAFYAIFNDSLSQSFNFSFSILLAILSVGINAAASKFTTSPTDVPIISDLCGIPGLSGLYSSHIPQGPLFVSTIMGYIATYMTLKGSSTSTWVPFVTWIVISLLQYGVLARDECLTNMQGLFAGSSFFGTISSGKLSPLWAIVLGGGTGAGLAAIIATYYHTSSGSSQKSVSPVTPTPGATPPSDVGTCSPPNDQDQFVCEAYKDGKLVTSTIASS